MEVFGNNSVVYSVTALDYKRPLNQLPPINFSLLTKFIQGNAIQGVFEACIRMGWYFNDYYTPPRILRTLKLAGIPFLLVKQVPFHHLSVPFIP